ncbi:unnamed protein product, partial [Urochloa humidicola]
PPPPPAPTGSISGAWVRLPAAAPGAVARPSGAAMRLWLLGARPRLARRREALPLSARVRATAVSGLASAPGNTVRNSPADDFVWEGSPVARGLATSPPPHVSPARLYLHPSRSHPLTPLSRKTRIHGGGAVQFTARAACRVCDHAADLRSLLECPHFDC